MLRELLYYDVRCHEQMADFQELFHDGHPEDYASIRQRFESFSRDVASMIEALEAMNPGVYSNLKAYHKKFDFYTRFLLEPPKIETIPPYVLTLDELNPDSRYVGNKSRHLAVVRDLGIQTPPGVAITVNGFHYFVAENNLREQIDRLLAGIDITSSASLHAASRQIMELYQEGIVPEQLEEEILAGCAPLFSDGSTTVAVRSSGIGEDGESSFAGQFISILHVGKADIVEAYKQVIASKYSAEALYYRIHQGWSDQEIPMSVLVMPMVTARSSGVVYTRDVVGDEGDRLQIHVVKGLGEQLVSGRTVADTYLVDRNTRAVEGPAQTGNISSETLAELTECALQIENEFSCSQDIEWTVDDNGQLFILQARSLHGSTDEGSDCERADIASKYAAHILVNGAKRASAGTGAGVIYRLDASGSIDDVPQGSVLITEATPPDFVRGIHKLAAVLSVGGSRASHFATVAREFRVPFLSGIENCFQLFHEGDTVTVDGYSGCVYAGVVEEILQLEERPLAGEKYRRTVTEAAKFITTLDLTDPAAGNFSPEGCRSMHDIIRFCHEKALQTLFSVGKPGSARGSLKLQADIPLDVYLFDVGGGMDVSQKKGKTMALENIHSTPFHALWKGMSHPDVQWKQKPFDWEAYDRIQLTGAVAPKKDSFAFASYAVIGRDYLHFNLRFGYHFTIVDVISGENSAENHCMMRFAGGGGDFEHRSLRIDFLQSVLQRLGFIVEGKGDLLDAKISGVERDVLTEKLDILGRLLGATKLMDMVLKDETMVQDCVNDFFSGRYSFSEEG